jgi:hypothetical protein
MTYPWVPGEVAVGSKVNAAPQVDAQKHVFQKGVATGGTNWSPPFVATPGTVATGGTVSNSTGYDVYVYASATTGISAAKLGTYSVPGSSSAGETLTFGLPAGGAITLTYSGSLTWLWLAV